MTPTEKAAESWLVSQGLHPRFGLRDTPDFSTEKGGFEVKVLRSGTITFSPGQIAKVVSARAKVLVFEEEGLKLKCVLSWRQIRNRKTDGIKVVEWKTNEGVKTVRLSDESWQKLMEIKTAMKARSFDAVIKSLTEKKAK